MVLYSIELIDIASGGVGGIATTGSGSGSGSGSITTTGSGSGGTGGLLAQDQKRATAIK